jgi:hypothetical protein
MAKPVQVEPQKKDLKNSPIEEGKSQPGGAAAVTMCYWNGQGIARVSKSARLARRLCVRTPEAGAVPVGPAEAERAVLTRMLE